VEVSAVAKTFRELFPLGVALVIFGAVVWFLVQRDMAIGTWLFAAFLAGHGWVHIMFATPRPQGAAATSTGTQFPFDVEHSWLVTRLGLDAHAVKIVVAALVALTISGYMLAAMATIGLLVPASLWAGLVVGATVTSGLLFVIGISPALALGIGIDLVLLWIVFATTYAPGGTTI
jgi:hypothetical protein